MVVGFSKATVALKPGSVAVFEAEEGEAVVAKCVSLVKNHEAWLVVCCCSLENS